MEHTKIPGSNMNASRVALGAWAIGGWMWGGTDERESIDTIFAALDKGVNLIDTAPVYGFGRSEEIVGKALAEYGQREKICLSTKAALDWRNGNVFRNSSPERIEKEIGDSLKRLRTDYIDIYFVHWPDPLVPFEKTAEAMKKLLDDGRIRAIGVSNYSPEQMDLFRKAAPVHVCQPPYNIFERQIENDVKNYCHENGIALMTYGALCRGLLSGKMTKDRRFEGDDLRNYDPKFQGDRFEQYLKAVEKLKKLAGSKFGKDLLPFAVRWILDRGVEIAIWGGRRPDQMEAINDVFGWSLDESAMKEVDSIVNETVEDPVGPEFMAPPAGK